MSDKHRDQIIRAATAAFMRYGYRRVTMSDLAAEAGISRPTLYSAFASKEAVFNAVARELMEQALAEIRERVAGPGSVAEKLEQVFEIWVVRAYELIHRSPDAKELLECTQAFSQDVIDRAYAELETLLASVIAPHASAGIEPKQVAHTLALSARGIKENARDLDDLRRSLAGLIALTSGRLSGSQVAAAYDPP
jgi:AcrR family transcriptional regulator